MEYTVEINKPDRIIRSKIYKTKIGALKYAEKLLKTCAVGDIVQVIWSDYKTAGVLVSWRIVPQEM